MSRRPPVLLLGAALASLVLIWGTTWAAIRVGLEGVPPFTGVALRFALAGSILFGIAIARRVPLGRSAAERRLWIVNGLLSFSLSYGVVYWAEQWLPSGLAAVLFSTFPLCVGLLAHVWLPDERLTTSALLGILIGIGGVAVLFSQDFSRLGGGRVAIAAAVFLLSPIASAVANVAVKRWGRGLHPLSITAVPMLLTGGLMGALALLVERHDEFHWTGTAVGALLYLALAGTAITFTLYFWLLGHLPATRLSLITYLIPVVALVVGVAALEEPVTARMIAGTILILGGVALVLRRRRVVPRSGEGAL